MGAVVTLGTIVELGLTVGVLVGIGVGVVVELQEQLPDNGQLGFLQ